MLQDPQYCTLKEVLGEGRNGAVQAMSTYLLPHAVFKKAGSKAAIEHEAGILRQVQHPSIVTAYGTMVGPPNAAGSQQHVYLAMERLGQSLEDRRFDRT